jgi:hypothetical protein
MADDIIAKTAEEVLRSLGMWRLPVDPLQIADEEGIKVKPGEYSDGFDARIEYFPMFRRFGIYYRAVGVNEGRMRFSLGHELGHYYLPHHRERLEKGESHNSESDFKSRDPLEHEADQFAAELLMPRELFQKYVSGYRQSVCCLKELMELASRLKTSIISTAIRYCECYIECSMLVLSQNG